MSINEGSKEMTITRIRQGHVWSEADQVAIEEPLEIQILPAGQLVPRSISVTMRTPGQDADLALGFLFTEGILSQLSAVSFVSFPGENQVCVHLREGVDIELANTERNFYTTSSCGVCGKSSIEAIRTHSQFDIRQSLSTISHASLFQLKEQLLHGQSLFAATGGIHAAALFSLQGQLLHMREDVGRHNALDKLIGFACQNDELPLSESVLLLSGRASFELIQKASMAGIPIIVAIGAPSSLAIELARQTGQTLLGFLKDSSFNLYTGHERIE